MMVIKAKEKDPTRSQAWHVRAMEFFPQRGKLCTVCEVAQAMVFKWHHWDGHRVTSSSTLTTAPWAFTEATGYKPWAS